MYLTKPTYRVPSKEEYAIDEAFFGFNKVSSHESWAEYGVKQLERVATHGLWEAYASPLPEEAFRSFLFDYYPTLPWGISHNLSVMLLIQAHPKLPEIAKAIKAVWGWDMVEDITDGIKECRAALEMDSQ